MGAAGRALQSGQYVLVIYVITLSGVDAAAALAESNQVVQALTSLSVESFEQTLKDELLAQSVDVNLERIVIDEPHSEAVDNSGDPVTLPPKSETTSSTTLSSEVPTPSPSPSPIPSPSPSPVPSSGSGNESTGADDEEDDGSVRAGPSCAIFALLALLRTTQA